MVEAQVVEEECQVIIRGRGVEVVEVDLRDERSDNMRVITAVFMIEDHMRRFEV